jgi:hypothetical protein
LLDSPLLDSFSWIALFHTLSSDENMRGIGGEAPILFLNSCCLFQAEEYAHAKFMMTSDHLTTRNRIGVTLFEKPEFATEEAFNAGEPACASNEVLCLSVYLPACPSVRLHVDMSADLPACLLPAIMRQSTTFMS